MSAILHGDLTDLGDYDEAKVCFEILEEGDDWTETDRETQSKTGEYSDDVTNLNSNTTYEFRAVAEANDDDRAEG